jgi:hypothetical protein
MVGSRKGWMCTFTTALIALTVLGNGQALVVPDARTASWIIKPGESVGPIRLGMSREEVKEAVGEPESRKSLVWNYSSDGFTVTFSPEGTVKAVFGGIGSPSVDSDSVPEYAFRFKARTPEGIGIGSTLEEVLAGLGTPSWETNNSGVKNLFYRQASLSVALWHDHVYNIALVTQKPAH